MIIEKNGVKFKLITKYQIYYIRKKEEKLDEYDSYVNVKLDVPHTRLTSSYHDYELIELSICDSEKEAHVKILDFIIDIELHNPYQVIDKNYKGKIVYDYRQLSSQKYTILPVYFWEEST